MQSHVNPPVAEPSDSGVPKPKRKRRAVLAPLALVVVLSAVTVGTMYETLLPAVSVEVEPVVAERVSAPAMSASQPASGGRVVQAPGWLEADPYLVACSALSDGVVKDIYVLEGESVTAGQPIAALVDDDARLALDDASAHLLLATANLQSAQADLDAAQTDWDNPVEDERLLGVSRAKVETKERELQQLGPIIEMESARLDGLQVEHDRLAEALKSGAATSTQTIIQQKAVDAQAAMLSATQQRRGILESQLVELQSEHFAATRAAQLRVRDRHWLDLAKAATLRAEANVNAAQAQADTAQLRLDRMTIYASISGNVQRRLKQPGDKVMLQMDSEHSSHIVHLYDPSMLQVRVDVPLADAAEIYVGQICEVVVDVLPDTTFVGEVTRVTHEADIQKNTLQVKVNVKDPLPVLKPEMLTRVKFLPTGSEESANNSSQINQQQRIFLVNPDFISGNAEGGLHVNTVRHRKGQAGRIDIVRVEQVGTENGYARIAGDLHASDMLALSSETLAQNQRVSITPRGIDGGQP